MRRLILGILILSWLPIAAQAALSDAEAVNKSGRERMLSQRIAKCYLMLAKEVSVEEAQQQLDESVALFEKQFQELQAYANEKNAKQALAQLESAWLPYRVMVLSKPSLRNATPVVMQSDVVLQAAENLVQQIQKKSAVKTAGLVNMSGRQRMLSQRIAKLYLAMYMHLNIPNLENEFHKALNQYEMALNNLNNANENTPQIAEALHRVRAQWDFSKAGFNQYEDGRFVPIIITTTTESMLKQMDAVTLSYQQVMDSKKLVTAN